MPQGCDHSTPTSFDNLSDGALADALGAVKAEAAELKAREDALKAELIARNISVAEGAEFRASVLPESIRWVLDADAIRAAMGEAWVLRHSTRSWVRPTVRLTARGVGRREAA